MILSKEEFKSVISKAKAEERRKKCHGAASSSVDGTRVQTWFECVVLSDHIGKNLLITANRPNGASVKMIATRAPSLPKKGRSEEHTSELQSRQYLVCRLLR